MRQHINQRQFDGRSARGSVHGTDRAYACAGNANAWYLPCKQSSRLPCNWQAQAFTCTTVTREAIGLRMSWLAGIAALPTEIIIRNDNYGAGKSKSRMAGMGLKRPLDQKGVRYLSDCLPGGLC